MLKSELDYQERAAIVEKPLIYSRPEDQRMLLLEIRELQGPTGAYDLNEMAVFEATALRGSQSRPGVAAPTSAATRAGTGAGAGTGAEGAEETSEATLASLTGARGGGGRIFREY